jgi:hypothetical protein
VIREELPEQSLERYSKGRGFILEAREDQWRGTLQIGQNFFSKWD